MNSRLTTFIAGVLTIAALALGTNAASAGVLFAVSGASNAPSSLYTVNTSTGAASLVGPTGFNHVTGIRWIGGQVLNREF